MKYGACLQILVAAAAALYLQTPARAQTPEQTALARSLFEQGVAQMDEGNWARAADHLRRSLSLRASSVVAYNLASALEHLGRLVEASELLRTVVRNTPPDREVHQAAAQLLETLEPRFARLTVALEGDAAGVELEIDETPMPLDAAGVPVPVDPGTHGVAALRDGQPVASDAVSLEEGAHAEVLLTLPPPPPSPPPAPEGKTEKQVALSPQKAAHSSGPAGRGRQFVSLRDDEVMDSVFTSPWFWVGVGAVAAVAITVGVVAGE